MDGEARPRRPGASREMGIDPGSDVGHHAFLANVVQEVVIMSFVQLECLVR
jgi:hypothetical protein